MEPGKEWPPLVPEDSAGSDRYNTIITDDVRPPPVNIITIYVEFITSDANPDPYYKSWIRMEMYKSGSRTYVR